MKRCPECRRDYADETLNYCLDDGNVLVSGPVTSSLAPTVIFPTIDGPFDSNTYVFSGAETSRNRPAANTIAVLPFLNLSRDEDGDYFSVGLAEELLNVLSKIRGLRVAARTSAFSFKGGHTTVSDIGRILNVASVLEGSVRRSNDRVRISVQLVTVADGFQLWSDTYDRTMDDIFAVQDDIAHSVVEEIRVRLLGEAPGDDVNRQVISEVASAVRGRSDDPEAQRLMMLGRYFLDRTTQEDSQRAIASFKEALALDPEFALCWAELGRAYSVQAGKAWISIDEGFRLSREATEHALSIEPELAEAHAQLGRILAAYDWDLRAADEEYKRALELAPTSSLVMDGASVLAYKLGRIDQALELSHKVLMQDPLSTAVWHNLGLFSYAAGLTGESEKAFRRAIEINPNRLVSAAMLSLVLMDQGSVKEAFDLAGNEPDPFWRHWALAILYHRSDRADEASAELAALIDEGADGGGSQIAEVFAVKGENDRAFEWLERAISERDPGVSHAGANPRFKTVHDDPRWSAVLKQIGL